MKPRSGRVQATLVLVAAAILLLGASPALPPPLPGDQPIAKVPENHRARQAYFESLIYAPRDKALAFGSPRIHTDEFGRKARVSLVARPDAFYALVENERGGSYSPYGQGSWAIKRDRATGQFVQAKLFLRSDPGIFARFSPLGNPESGRVAMEASIYGGVVTQGLILPISFTSLLTAPLERIRQLSGAALDWSLFSPEPALYADTESMVRAIRAALPGLAYGEDGAVDGEGRNVKIATGEPISGKGKVVLNCSGFAKWIADGMRTASGAQGLIGLDQARRRWPGLRGSGITAPYEESRDPYFGLDWVRNLATIASPLRTAAGVSADPTAHDVRIDPFPLIGGYGDHLDASRAYEPYPDWMSESGYRGSGVKALMYILALKEPGNFYFASVNKWVRGSPSLRQHTHVAALFPYFGSDGVFRVAVFESAEETSIDALQERTRDDYLFLVRLRSEARPDFAAASGQAFFLGTGAGEGEAPSLRR